MIRRHHVRVPVAARLAPMVLLLALCGCSALDHGFLNAAGPVATDERHLFFIVSAVLVFVAGPVLLLVPLFAWHYRLGNADDAYRPNWNFSWWVEGLIWIPPIGIVIGLAVLLWNWTHLDDPYRKLAGGPPIEVEAVALDWKWLFIYPDEGFATVNQLALPVGRPMHIRLTSGTVMQSLLIPQLSGQIYAMAGMTTELNIAASRPGRYLGQNTQYNGAGFARQKFTVLALSGADYQAWLGRVHRAPAILDQAAWRTISQRTVAPHPRFFGAVVPGLFQRVLTETSGGAHAAMTAHAAELAKDAR
ncbi:cytochrome ubiquinol oxidase subunit II [Sphingomonas sp. TREG-RG-20F-R18-01]|uniref:cytochrome ubiquinol oxidase subunit II n=1 Tax=Sphingomonas sp. TREG-RG-20F-R18-01 TaxID=2914982 RepID=UPI001F5A0FB3|nr:cytochrome ubiquinol oxidase subunit II [Sphingomonas sp. TREG-RG-20F-R18-01]